MAGKNKKTDMLLKNILAILCVLLGGIFLIMLGGTIYAEYLLSQLNYVDPEATVQTLSLEELEAFYRENEIEDPEFTGPEIQDEDVVFESVPTTVFKSEDVVNILLVGADYQNGERPRSDSMILCTFNKTTNTITLTSIMRDMYVQIPGYKNNRINASYFYGGMTLLEGTLNRNFGVETDGMVEIDFKHFKELINMLGGIELDLSYKEAQFINLKTGSQLEPGVQVVTGRQALWYSRFRGDAGGDFNRTNRQRVVLMTLLEEYKSKSLPELLTLMHQILPMVTTNMTKDQITFYVTDLFPMLTSAKIVTQRIPVEGAYYQARINNMAVLVPDITKNVKALTKTLEAVEPQGVG